jgi:hypothetical protein
VILVIQKLILNNEYKLIDYSQLIH